MPVSLVNPSSTSCGMYSDQPNRLTSAADRPAAPPSRAKAETSDFSTFFMVGIWWLKDSAGGFFQVFREEHKRDRRDDEQRRQRVQHRVEADLGEAIDADRQRGPL